MSGFAPEIISWNYEILKVKPSSGTKETPIGSHCRGVSSKKLDQRANAVRGYRMYAESRNPHLIRRLVNGPHRDRKKVHRGVIDELLRTVAEMNVDSGTS